MKYKNIRSQMLTGHAIVWKGKGIISSLIMKWSPFSHASLIVRLREYKELKRRVFLVEALADGLEFRLLSERLKEGGEAYWLPTDMTIGQMSKSREHALLECARGIPYDYGSLFKNIFGRVSSNARKYFCSEFVWLNWVYAGYVRTDEKILVAPRPGDLPTNIDVKPIRICN